MTGFGCARKMLHDVFFVTRTVRFCVGDKPTTRRRSSEGAPIFDRLKLFEKKFTLCFLCSSRVTVLPRVKPTKRRRSWGAPICDRLWVREGKGCTMFSLLLGRCGFAGRKADETSALHKKFRPLRGLLLFHAFLIFLNRSAVSLRSSLAPTRLLRSTAY